MVARVKKGKVMPESRPIRLQVVHLNGVDYIVDLRLKEFRTVKQPLCFIPFDTETGKQLLDECFMEVCPYCFRIAVFSKDTKDDEIECGECYRMFPITELKWTYDY